MKMQDQSQEIRKNLITDTVTYYHHGEKKTTLEISKSQTPPYAICPVRHCPPLPNRSANVQSCNFSVPTSNIQTFHLKTLSVNANERQSYL